MSLYNLKYKHLTLRKNTTDGAVFRDIFLYGDLKIPSTIKPEIIIDAGAYVGYSTVYFSRNYPSATIIAVEPEQSNFKQLKAHTNHLPNVIRVNGGLWPVSSKLKISDRGTGKWGFKVDEVTDGSNFDVQGYTVNELLDMTDVKTNNVLVKIDIEGSEQEIFSRNTHIWLPKVQCVLIELHNRISPGCSEIVANAMPNNLWDKVNKGEKLFFTRRHA